MEAGIKATLAKPGRERAEPSGVESKSNPFKPPPTGRLLSAPVGAELFFFALVKVAGSSRERNELVAARE